MNTARKRAPVASGARRCIVPLVTLGMIAACGDAHSFTIDPGKIDPDSVPSDHACLMGSTIRLSRHSSACEGVTGPLSAEVASGTVFSADDVATLGPPCADGPTPGFEVVFNEASHNIFIDFSDVVDGGRFPNGGFEGYALDVTLEEHNGLLLDVAMDREVSTLDLDVGDIAWDRDHIEINLQGVTYDDGGLIKLDLFFARIAPVTD